MLLKNLIKFDLRDTKYFQVNRFELLDNKFIFIYFFRIDNGTSWRFVYNEID